MIEMSCEESGDFAGNWKFPGNSELHFRDFVVGDAPRQRVLLLLLRVRMMTVPPARTASEWLGESREGLMLPAFMMAKLLERFEADGWSSDVTSKDGKLLPGFDAYVKGVSVEMGGAGTIWSGSSFELFVSWMRCDKRTKDSESACLGVILEKKELIMDKMDKMVDKMDKMLEVLEGLQRSTQRQVDTLICQAK